MLEVEYAATPGNARRSTAAHFDRHIEESIQKCQL